MSCVTVEIKMKFWFCSVLLPLAFEQCSCNPQLSPFQPNGRNVLRTLKRIFFGASIYSHFNLDLMCPLAALRFNSVGLVFHIFRTHFLSVVCQHRVPWSLKVLIKTLASCSSTSLFTFFVVHPSKRYRFSLEAPTPAHHRKIRSAM